MLGCRHYAPIAASIWMPVARTASRDPAGARDGEVLACPCGGRRTVTAFVVDTTLARRVLTALGQAAEPATFAPARDPPQAEFAWDAPAYILPQRI